MPRVRYEELTQQELDRLIPLLADASKARALLPKEQRHRHREAQESVVAARRAAEKRAGQLRVP